jgi:tape measure domain-containing protein
MANSQHTVQTEIRLATEQFLSELQRLESKYGSTMKSVSSDTDKTAATLEQSFKVLGIKGVQAVEREVKLLQAALAEIRNSPDVLPADKAAAVAAFNKRLVELRGEAQQVPPQLRAVGQEAEQAGTSLATAAHKAVAWTAALAGISSAGDVVGQLVATGSEFENLRVRLENLLGGTEKAQTAFAMIKNLAATTPFEVSSLTESFIKLTAFGMQPTEAQMRSLVDVAANLGGGTEVLTGVTLALGQAWAKGKLQGEEIMQLAERGVPVWDALARATGRSVPELQRMSEAGTLGRDVISRLIDELGRMNAGASDKLMNTYAGAVSNAKDALAEFYDMVAQSGVLEFLTGKLKELLAEFDRMKQSGELQAHAKAIADSFISIATAVESAIKVVADFGPQIKILIEAALALKAANMAGALLSIATGARAAATAVAATGAASAAAAVQMGAAAAAGGRVVTVLRVLRSLTGIGLVLGVAELAQEFFRAKRAAEEGDIAVKKMLASPPAENHPKKAAEDAAQSMEKIPDKAQDARAAFDQLIAKGDSAGEAISKIGKDFDLSNAPGIRDAAVVLDGLLADGVITAQQFRDQWQASLKDVNLTEFEARARQAMEGARDGVDPLQQAIDAGLREAVRRAGGDFDVLAGGMGKAAQRAVSDVDFMIDNLGRLRDQGVDVGQALSMSLGRAINTADSQAALDALRTRIEAVRGQLGDKMADGLLEQAARKAEELRAKLDAATGGINSVAEAMGKLGMKSIESMRLAASEAQSAYGVIKAAGQQEGESYLAWQLRKQEAARAMLQRMIEANGGVADAATRARAAAEGLKLGTDESGRTIVKSMRDAKRAVDDVGDAAGRAGKGFRGMAQEAANAANSTKRLREIYDRHRLDAGDPNKSDIDNLYDRNRMDSWEEGEKKLNKSRSEVSGNATLTKEYVDAQIAKQWGEKFIGDSDAMELFNAKIKLEAYRTNYGNVARSQQSLNEQNALLQTVQRLEEKLRARQAEGEQKAPPKQADVAPEPAAPRSPSSGSGMHAGGSTGGGSVSYVSNITLPGGQRKSMRFADADSQATNDRLLRDLAAARGVAQ